MKTPTMPPPAVWMIVIAFLTTGCEPDNRLLELSERSLQRQAEQNRQMAEQSQRIADATAELIAADALARQEFSELSQGLQAERASIDRQQESLEEERRKIAGQRHRDPIIAEAIGNCGLIIACGLPLVFCAYLLHVLLQRTTPDEALVELFLEDLLAKQPRLLLSDGCNRDSTQRLLPGAPKAPLIDEDQQEHRD